MYSRVCTIQIALIFMTFKGAQGFSKVKLRGIQASGTQHEKKKRNVNKNVR